LALCILLSPSSDHIPTPVQLQLEWAQGQQPHPHQWLTGHQHSSCPFASELCLADLALLLLLLLLLLCFACTCASWRGAAREQRACSRMKPKWGTERQLGPAPTSTTKSRKSGFSQVCNAHKLPSSVKDIMLVWKVKGRGELAL
jgi:hypothetical protein